MADIGALLASLVSGSGLAQYPDKKVYNAAAQLTPEERPQVQVRIEDHDPARFPILRVKPATEALAVADPTHGDPFITVFRGTNSYNNADPRLLAGLLAHEAVHVKRKDDQELPAYEQQEATLKRLGYPMSNQRFMTALLARIAQLKKRPEQ